MSREFFKALMKFHRKANTRMPRQAEPLAIQRSYLKKINRVLEDTMSMVRAHLIPRLERMAEHPSRVADAVGDDLGAQIDDIRKEVSATWTRTELSGLVRPTADETARFQGKQLNKQLRAAMSVETATDVVGNEPWLLKAIEEFTRENVALIRSIPEQLLTDLEKHLAKELADGARWETLADTIEQRYEVSQERAALIARDQVGKFNGDLNRVRQEDLGVKSFIWRTTGDERVRSDHAVREGVEYDWNAPPDGETPGEPVNCRCYAEPVIPQE